ncbi:MAG: radical SAM protein [Planctomycetales bacterium]|nr:radical SAM protein [Planctomycetales bacterium]
MSQKRYKYLFGPVPSRRLGRSLGVDIVPLKTCTQNCIYCQLGKDAPQTLHRSEYAPINAVLGELRHKIQDGPEADYITISGSGEPTLHSGLGRLIDGIRQLTRIPVAIITNGTLLNQAEVRTDCCKADVVLPSLDAGDAETFRKINLPHPQLSFTTFVEGLVQFRREYTGQFWLEIFFCEGINTDETAILNLKTWIERIKPDKIQLNTAVRPVVHPEAGKVEPEKLQRIARLLSPQAEVIADFSGHVGTDVSGSDETAVLEMLLRRPCSLDDICSGLGLLPHIVQKVLAELLKASKITCEEKGQKKYYKAL